MKELDLNSLITVSLNEYGFERRQQIEQEIRENQILEDKEGIIKLLDSRIDENGRLTAPLLEVLGSYPSYCFQSETVIVHQEHDLYELDLNSLITVSLNEYGFERRQQIEQEIRENQILEDQEGIIKLLDSRIDENGRLTAPLLEVLGSYPSYCFQSKTVIVHEMENEKDQNASDIRSRKN